MPNEELLMQNKNLYKAWQMFLKKEMIEDGTVRDVVVKSWKRSKEYGVNPLKGNIDVQLDKKSLDKKYREFMPLVETSKPFMDSLYKIVEKSGLLVRLTDKDGYVLEFIGDKSLSEKYGDLNVYRGCNVKEEVIGTNAIGTALHTGSPIQILGAEHYGKQYHGWGSSACPIRNEYEEIIGILSMTGPLEKVQTHTLGMVVAAAEAIENELKLDHINNQLKIANKHFHAIMESISEGLICINNESIITDMNLFARKMLFLKEEDVIGKSINTILYNENKDRIIKAIKKGQKYEEEEIYLKKKTGKKILCMATFTPIKDTSNKKLEGVVITFREAKVVHSLINRIVGAEARFTFDDILGNSYQIEEAIEMAKKSSNYNTTVLLNGESGTGKELFAQSIHNASSRKNRPFIFLNCGAIPRDLVASELFGYVEGAFTGAKRGGHPGKFELADGGTIFLDEIGDMPLDTQANLLRVLETREIVRVGGHEVIPVNVRVIAATHKDLEREVELGNFRQDLYYRLNVMPIKIPPLRERKEDVKALTDYFLEKFCIRMEKRIVGVSTSFYRGMIKYNWPGNVRELQNVMQQIINMADDKDTLTYKNIPNYIKPNNISNNLETTNRLLSLEDIEKITIEKTVNEVGGNLSLASRILGISRSSLYRKIYKYNLESVLK